MNSRRGFGTAINCIDGRTQEPVAAWVRERFQVEYVDVITEPGPDRVLSGKLDNVINALKGKVQLSVSAHGSRVVAVVGHYQCAANPVSTQEHVHQIKEAAQVVAGWMLPVAVLGLWVDSAWKCEELISLP